MAELHGLADPLFDPPEAKVDIVFLHGLGGDRTRTWTWEGNGRAVFWPQDLLPQACPTARILTFGYNANFAHFFPLYGPKFVAKELTIDNHSTELFQSLIGFREKTKTTDRPVIFVSHSLGGLVCANALSRPHGTDQASAALVKKTIGVIFLGTPFEGSHKAKWADRARTVLAVFSTTQKNDIKDLKERSAKLMSINDAFQKLLKARDRSKQFIEVACFFEECSMYNAGAEIGIIVPKESASLPGINSQSINENHVDMCKFADDKREGYKKVSQLLSRWTLDLDRAENASGADQAHSVYMGDVYYRGEIRGNGGVVMGHAHTTATDGNRITGSITNHTYHGLPPSNPGGTAG